MRDANILPENLNKIFIELKSLVRLIPVSQNEFDQEQLFNKCINEIPVAKNLTEDEKAQLVNSLQKIDNIGDLINTTERGYHRPLSVPNDKYPSISKHSEALVWQSYDKLRPAVYNLIDSNHVANLDKKAMSDFLDESIDNLIKQFGMTLNEREHYLIKTLFLDDIFGLGPLEQLMADPAVTDILVNGCDNIYIERNGLLRKCTLCFRDNEHLTHIIRRFVNNVGRRIDYSSPYVDARLADGSRINAIIPPLAIDFPTLSIRRFGRRQFFLDHMVKTNSMSLKMASFLSLAVKAKLNIIISGGTGSGKTTLLNAMSRSIDVNERIVTVEDSAELKLLQPHVVRLETRKADNEGRGLVVEQELVKNALRMRPDRIILGEARGAEALDMIQAMNTGHSGSMCTIHANSSGEVASRICNMVAMSGVEQADGTILRQIANVIHLVVQVARMRDGKRRVLNISEVTGEIKNQKLVLKTLFEYKYDKSASTDVVGEFVQIDSIPERCLEESVNEGMYDNMRSLFPEVSN